MEVDKRLIALRKAELLAGGSIYIPKDFHLPFLPSRSSAGPGAGSVAIVLAFDGVRVKKTMSMAQGDFVLVEHKDHLSLNRDNKPFIDGVEICSTLYHAPEQAFFNLDTKCILGCKFCTARFIDDRISKALEPEKIISLVISASKKKDFRSVSFTSAVARSPSDTVARLAFVISEVRKLLPAVPIGVEPYLDSLTQVDSLKEAGADEMKLNIESFDRDIIKKVCPGKDIDFTMNAIERAVEVFGRGKVCSNIIVGMGEDDDNVLKGVEALADLGCVATIRPLRSGDQNRSEMIAALGRIEPVSPERLVRLAEEEKRILEARGLSTLTFRTMCHECRCCDIVPFRDI
jgi:biotin synthase-related radical SAM superfamily protein